MKFTLKKLSLSILATSLLSLPVLAHEGDDPLLAKVMIDQLEWRDSEAANNQAIDTYVLEGQAWIGKDLNKFWLKTDVEYVDGETEEAEIQALYSRAIAPFWDLQIGLRQDLKPEPTREWGVIGIEGLAPYFFEVDAALFVGESGATAARISAEYEWMFTQKLVLSPEISLNFYGQNDSKYQTGSGLSDINLGLRLRYEIRREFAPYIGVNWSKSYGNTADFVREHGEEVSDAQAVAGVRVWF